MLLAGTYSEDLTNQLYLSLRVRDLLQGIVALSIVSDLSLDYISKVHKTNR